MMSGNYVDDYVIEEYITNHGVNKIFYGKHTLLHVCVSFKKINMIKLLLQCGANQKTLNHLGFSPLVTAIQDSNIEIVKLLLAALYEQNENVNCVFSTLESFKKAFHKKRLRGGEGLRFQLLFYQQVNLIQLAIDSGNMEIACLIQRYLDLEKRQKCVFALF